MPSQCLFIFNSKDKRDLVVKDRLVALELKDLKLYDVDNKSVYDAIRSSSVAQIAQVPAFVVVTEQGFNIYYDMDKLLDQLRQKREEDSKPPAPPVKGQLKLCEGVQWGQVGFDDPDVPKLEGACKLVDVDLNTPRVHPGMVTSDQVTDIIATLPKEDRRPVRRR